MKMLTKKTAQAMVIGLAGVWAMSQSSAYAQNMMREKPATIQVSANESVMANPDMATVTLGAVSTGNVSQEVFAANNKIVQAITDGLKALEINDDDIQTSQVVVEQMRLDDANAPIRYRVSNQLTITVRQLDKLGAILDKSVEAGANTIDDIEFSMANPAPLLDQARQLSVQSAIKKADILAKAANLKLGAVKEMIELNSGLNTSSARLFMSAASSSIPIKEGLVNFSAGVQMTFGLEPQGQTNTMGLEATTTNQDQQ